MTDQEKDHELQAVDTPLPSPDFVDTPAWEQMRRAWLEEHPDEDIK